MNIKLLRFISILPFIAIIKIYGWLISPILKIITSMIKSKILILVYLEQYPIVDREI